MDEVFKIHFTKFLNFIAAIAIASPNASCEVVLAVGTIPPASITFGIKSLISEALYKIDSFLILYQLIKFYSFLHTE